jgi:hypothetical protein
MSAMGTEVERIGTRDFFAREYFVEDIRWMAARLLGNPGRGEFHIAPEPRAVRATA